jgi:hypothetical protein
MALSAVLEKHATAASSRDQQTTIAMPAGLIGGAETVLLYTLMLGLPAEATNVAWVMTVGVAISALQRVWWAVQRLPDIARQTSQSLRQDLREDGPRQEAQEDGPR